METGRYLVIALIAIASVSVVALGIWGLFHPNSKDPSADDK